MTNDNEFISINKMMSRDIETNSTDKKLGQSQEISQKSKIYQIEGNKNKSTCNLIYLGEHDTTNISIQNILTFKHPEYDEIKCEMVGHIIDANEITDSIKSKYLKLIGFLLSIDNKIICSCDYVFCPKNTALLNLDTLFDNKIENVDGTFKIILFYKKNEKYYYDIIKEYTEYHGKEESIYILTTALLEENVIGKYFEKYVEPDKENK